ncbi:MAG TPA: site-specific integrase [Stellaceae bacterium]|nr:site-specific integrase [Stellaceae bacterium]
MRGNITRRGDRSWRLKFESGERNNGTGKRQTKFVTVRGTRRDAERELTRILNAIETGAFVEPSKMTVEKYLETWLDHAKQRVSAKTFSRYEEIVKKHLSVGLGSHCLTKLTPLAIQDSYSKALASGRRNGLGGLSAQTVKHHHRILSEALRQAVRWRLLHSNPCDLVEPPRPARREMHIIDQKQTAQLLKAAEPKRIYMPVLLAVTTGMRRGELLALRWKNVDLDSSSLAVTQTLEKVGKQLTFKAPKTERSRRTISLPQYTVEALRKHRAKLAEERLAAGKAYHALDLVCCNELGQPMDPGYVTRTFANLAKTKFGIRFHDLRHSHISHLLAAGVHPKIASERAGHASISITLDVYSHVIPGMQEDAAKRIDAALRAHIDG